MSRFLSTILLGAALIAPIALAPTALLAQDHKIIVYHDKRHNDDHEWNDHEDRAYRIWVTQNHRKWPCPAFASYPSRHFAGFPWSLIMKKFHVSEMDASHYWACQFDGP